MLAKDETLTIRIDPPHILMEFFSDEPKTDDRMQVEELIRKHHDEITIHKHVQHLKPDWKRYRELVLQNRIFVVSARLGTRIVGYGIFFVQRHLHDKDLIYAMDDLFYIDADVRGKRLGKGLIETAEAHAKLRGAKILLLRAKVGSQAEKLLPFIGYSPFETVLAKEL